MLEFGIALSSEEHRPQDLVRFAAQAEEGGMDYAILSDHFHPWIEAQGQSPFAWSVLGRKAREEAELTRKNSDLC